MKRRGGGAEAPLGSNSKAPIISLESGGHPFISENHKRSILKGDAVSAKQTSWRLWRREEATAFTSQRWRKRGNTYCKLTQAEHFLCETLAHEEKIYFTQARRI